MTAANMLDRELVYTSTLLEILWLGLAYRVSQGRNRETGNVEVVLIVHVLELHLQTRQPGKNYQGKCGARTSYCS